MVKTVPGYDHNSIIHQFIANDIGMYSDWSGIIASATSTSEKVTQSKIHNSDYYIDGTTEVDKATKEIVVQFNLRNKSNGALIKERSFRNINLFEICDSIANYLPLALEMSNAQMEGKVNIPADEATTKDLEALGHYARAMNARSSFDFQLEIDEAISRDSTFAYAYLWKSIRLNFYDVAAYEANDAIAGAMKYRKRLPLKHQLLVLVYNHLINHDWEKAEKLLLMQLEQDAKNTDYQGLLWNLYMNTEQYDKLVTYSQKMFKTNPTAPMSAFLLGQAYMHAGQPEKVIGPLKTMLLLDAQNKNILNFLAAAYMAAGEYEIAKEQYEKLILYHPDEEVIIKPTLNAISYMQSTPDYKEKMKKWIGSYRSTVNEQVWTFKNIGEQLFCDVSNIIGYYAYPYSDTTITEHGLGFTSEFIGQFDDDDNLITIKLNQYNTDYDNVPNYTHKVQQDSLIWKAERMIVNQEYSSSIGLLDEAINKHQTNYYLNNMLSHVDYMQSINKQYLASQLQELEGDYQGLFDLADTEAQLWVEEGLLFYKRPGLTRRVLRPMGKNQYMVMSSYDHIYKTEIGANGKVEIRLFIYDHQLGEYVIDEDWALEKEVLKG